MSREFGPVEVQGKPLRCNVCDHTTFWEREIELPTSFLNFLAGEEWNGLAQCAICERCGFIHWFVPPSALREVEADDDAKPFAAPA